MRKGVCTLSAAGLALLSVLSYAGERHFPVFDATLYANKPDLSAIGMEPITLVSVLDISPTYTLAWKANPKLAQPSPDEIQELAKRLKKSGITRIVFDFEQWQETPETIDETVSKFETLIARMHKAAPDIKVGIYNYVPVSDYWASIQSPNSDKYKSWQEQNNHLKTLAQMVDFLAPSLYTFFDDSEHWKAFAAAEIAEGKRIAPNKPIYPFIWPQFHDNNKQIGLQYIPKAFWQMQLDITAKLADGVIIWGGYDIPNRRPAQWNSSAEWWGSTQKFIQHP